MCRKSDSHATKMLTPRFILTRSLGDGWHEKYKPGLRLGSAVLTWLSQRMNCSFSIIWITEQLITLLRAADHYTPDDHSQNLPHEPCVFAHIPDGYSRKFTHDIAARFHDIMMQQTCIHLEQLIPVFGAISCYEV